MMILLKHEGGSTRRGREAEEEEPFGLEEVGREKVRRI